MTKVLLLYEKQVTRVVHWVYKEDKSDLSGP